MGCTCETLVVYRLQHGSVMNAFGYEFQGIVIIALLKLNVIIIRLKDNDDTNIKFLNIKILLNYAFVV